MNSGIRSGFRYKRYIYGHSKGYIRAWFHCLKRFKKGRNETN